MIDIPSIPSMPSAAGSLTVAQAAVLVRNGGLAVYPTETFYGLGGVAAGPRAHEAADALAALKGRESWKPLPVVVGAVEQLAQLTPGYRDALRRETFARLVEVFWPGPLAVALPAWAALPAWHRADPATHGLPAEYDAVVGEDAETQRGVEGLVAVRLSGHPVARALARESGAPLAATSANFAGEPPASRPEALSPALVEACGGWVAGGPPPAGGAPSTIVALARDGALVVAREGAVAVTTLHAHGFRVAAGG